MNNCPAGCLPPQSWFEGYAMEANEPWVCAVQTGTNYIYECQMIDNETFRCIPGVANGNVWLDTTDTVESGCGYFTTEDPPEEEPPITICDSREQKSNCNIL